MQPVALIVGGRGFVGPHLARQLSDRYCVLPTGRAEDVRDRNKMLEAVAGANPEVVVNLASITTVRESVERPRETYEIGVFGLLNVLEALQAHGFRGRFLHVSSSEVCGFPAGDELPIAETAPLRPMSPYAVAKAAGEMLCHQWAHSGAFGIVVARPFTHIGPGQSDRFAVARFARQIVEIILGKRAPILKVGALNATRDLTDVRDVALAYDQILHNGEVGNVYNVCSGREVRMRDVLDQLIRAAGVDVKISEDASLTRKAEQQRLWGTYAKLEALTGWAPQIPLAQTLSDIMQSLLAGEQRVEA
ncbi:MAG: GDP-mannose 4,6-dehydratase [Methylocystis sp.]|nr:GDP-mannose 4,6-dehydratase [Methylocystis sp.]